jgi:predicted enzyme related to lactoylglutathione lyase
MPIIKGFDNDSSLSETIAGGSIVVPTRAIQGVEYQAHFRDPEGNVIGIMENDPSAR